LSWAMAKLSLRIRLHPSTYDGASDLLVRMAYGIQSCGGKVWTKAKPEGYYHTHFSLYTHILVKCKKAKVAMDVTRGPANEGGVPCVSLRTRRKHMGQAQAFVRAILDRVIGETIEYAVDVVSNTIRWRMSDRTGCVADVFDVVQSVDRNSCGEKQWHVFDFQNHGTGTFLKDPFYF